MSFLARSVFNVFVIVLFFGAYEVVAADDAYLKMLEGEAEELSLDSSGQINNKEENVSNEKSNEKSNNDTKWDDVVSDLLPPGLAEKDFSTYLKKYFYGTYVFYRRLNEVDKRTIYYHYSKKESVFIDIVRKDILTHLKK